jgi:hypothetical protein
VGAWLVTVKPAGAPPVQGFLIYAADGGLIWVPPGLRRSVGVGTWVRTGERENSETFVVHDRDESFALTGRNKVQARVKLDETGNTFQAVYRSTLFDLSGNEVSATDGTSEGVRIRVEPLT